jgi:hypothetical protein
MVTTTPTEIPALEPAADESALVVMLVFRFEEIVTSPLLPAEIVLVPESWLFAEATSTVAATEESFLVLSDHLPRSPASSFGCVEVGPTASVATYRLSSPPPPIASLTTSPLT